MDEKLTRLFAGRAVAWDRLLLTDGLPPEAVDRLTALTPAAPERVWVVLDHDAPAGTVAVAEKQKKLQDFARRTGARFFSGRDIGYALLLEDGLREGEIVLSGGSHAAGVGAAGAAGLCLDSASLAEALVSGQVSLPAQAPLRAALTGALSPYLSVRDLALSLIAGGRCAGRAVVLSGGHILRDAPAAEVSVIYRTETGSEETLSLTIGGASLDGQGRYLRLNGEEAVYQVSADGAAAILSAAEGGLTAAGGAA